MQSIGDAYYRQIRPRNSSLWPIDYALLHRKHLQICLLCLVLIFDVGSTLPLPSLIWCHCPDCRVHYGQNYNTLRSSWYLNWEANMYPLRGQDGYENRWSVHCIILTLAMYSNSPTRPNHLIMYMVTYEISTWIIDTWRYSQRFESSKSELRI